MNYRLITLTITATAVGALCLSAAFPKAQTAAPASKATPRMPDGHPDLNGNWYHRIGPPVPVLKPGQSYDAAKAKPPSVNGYAPPIKPKYKPEYVEKVKYLDEHQIDVDPGWYCGPPGVPRIGPPHKIIQTAKEIAFFYDDLSGNFYRIVRMNGTHRTDIEPSAHGDSIGHWEEDTLVVDVTNLDESTWLADHGAVHSDKTHVIERFRRDGDTLTYDVITEDPFLAEPYAIRGRALKLMTNYEIEEAPQCIERDRPNTDITKGAHAGHGT